MSAQSSPSASSAASTAPRVPPHPGDNLMGFILRALYDKQICVELTSDYEVVGLLANATNDWVITLKNARVSRMGGWDAISPPRNYALYTVRNRHVRYVHIPKNIRVGDAVNAQLRAIAAAQNKNRRHQRAPPSARTGSVTAGTAAAGDGVTGAAGAAGAGALTIDGGGGGAPPVRRFVPQAEAIVFGERSEGNASVNVVSVSGNVRGQQQSQAQQRQQQQPQPQAQAQAQGQAQGQAQTHWGTQQQRHHNSRSGSGNSHTNGASRDRSERDRHYDGNNYNASR
mgnify:CR=1 FL=1